MKNCIGIRRENKDLTERRAPFTPPQVQKLVAELRLKVLVEPGANRVFAEEEYRRAGAIITPELRESNIIFGIKEIPKEDLTPRQTYFFFSHTIKGQPYNMPMLKKIMELEDTLLDYELVKNEQGIRQIFFGNFAGYAGMIDSLWALGERLRWEGFETPLQKIRPAHRYASLEEAESAIREVGHEIQQKGFPRELVPLVCGFTGYGRVSKGAQHIFDLLPVIQISAGELSTFMQKGDFSARALYKVEFHEQDMVRLKPDQAQSKSFELQDYFSHPEKYEGKFVQYLPYLTMIINGIYWEPRYPRLVTRKYLRELFRQESRPRLRVIGDISCDIDGSIEMTVKATNSLNPLYVFDPFSEKIADGWEGHGVVIMAVDKLPAELPREASDFFGNSLLPYMPELAAADFEQPFQQIDLSEMLKKALIVHQGALTPDFRYLEKHLKGV